MPRPYPNRRRRRPGRRPPQRYSHGPAASRLRGFTEAGYKQLYDLFLPFQGWERRAFFNDVSGVVVLGFALAGLAIGSSIGGFLGALAGLIGGILAGGAFVENGRFYRP